MRKAFYRMAQAWYAEENEPESFMVGMYDETGGTTGEFKITWEDSVGCQLKAYCDGWSVLYEDCQDVLKILACWGEELTPDLLEEELLKNGYVNATPKTKDK